MKTLKLITTLVLAAALLIGCSPAGSQLVHTRYILTTALRDGKFVFLGVDGGINGLVNPILQARPGETITILLVNSGEGSHDLVIPELDIRSAAITRQGETTSITFAAPVSAGELEYLDSSHADLGMRGILLIGEGFPAAEEVGQAAPTAGSVEPTGLTVEYALSTALTDGRMVFLGVGGEIDGQVNPDLKANPGDTVRILLTSGEGAVHNIAFEGFGVQSADVSGQENQVVLEFIPDLEGTFPYFCAIPGHRQAGMEGSFIVGSGVFDESQASNMDMNIPGGTTTVSAGPFDPQAVDIVRDPSDLPGPIGTRGPQNVRIDLETVEVSGILTDGTSFTYWTFDGKVPGPFLRVRVGDTVEVHLKNNLASHMAHSVDFHAVTGPGGGAVATQTHPGGETSFTFRALNPGLYVYHCATPMVAQHIANGMYGLILVEPEGGLPPVDHEFYVMQGELYTAQPYGTSGALTDDVDKLLDEEAEYFVFNGAAMALAGDAHALHAATGETVRIYFGVGGPNFVSSFHVIGEIFDRVYDQASLTSSPLTDVQTTLVPPGGATMVEFTLDVPGRYILVDHALSRMQRGLAGFLYVEGDPAPDIFHGEETAGSGH